MDVSHAAVAAIGAVVAWWLSGGREQKLEIPACHCVCSVKPEGGSGSSSGDWLLWLLVIGAGVVLIGANLFLVFRVTVKNLEGGDREYSLSVKGKAGSKGVYGAPKGLQLLDR